MRINITEQAQVELTKIRGEKEELQMRIIIASQGCNGSFTLSLGKSLEDDYVERVDGVSVAVNQRLLEMYEGFEVGYRVSPFGSGFTVNAMEGSIGCFIDAEEEE